MSLDIDFVRNNVQRYTGWSKK